MNEIEIIKNYFNGKTKSQVIHLLPKFFKEYKELEKYCKDYLNYHPEFEKISSFICSIVFNIELRKCKNCRKIIKIFISKG